MWLSGKNPLREALKRGESIEKVLIEEGVRLKGELLDELRRKGIPFERVKSAKIEKLTGTKKHQGIAFLLSPIKLREAESIMESTLKERGYMVVIDGVEDPGNLGNIIRSSLSFGATGLILKKRKTSPITETVVKRSAGAVFHLNIGKVSNLRYFIEEFKERGGYVYSLEIGGEPLQKVSFAFPLAIIVGGEDRGVSKILQKISDRVVTIEQEEGVGSLNVASATAIVLYQIYRSLKGK